MLSHNKKYQALIFIDEFIMEWKVFNDLFEWFVINIDKANKIPFDVVHLFYIIYLIKIF
jgi:hypothetical protein